MQLAKNDSFYNMIWKFSSWYINLFDRFLTEDKLY